MSETDSFIQEVTEEVRQDQMFALWKKWGPYVIGGVVLIVGAAAYWSWTQQHTREAAEMRGGTFLATDPESLDQKLSLPDKIDGDAKLIADLTAAGALAADGQADEAAKRYAEIAERPGLARHYRDLAVLQTIRLGGADGDAKIALDEMVQDNSPYRLLALELRAALSLQAADAEAAHADLNTILTDVEATPGLRQRAAAMLLASGGTLEGVGQTSSQ